MKPSTKPTDIKPVYLENLPVNFQQAGEVCAGEVGAGRCRQVR